MYTAGQDSDANDCHLYDMEVTSVSAYLCLSLSDMAGAASHLLGWRAGGTEHLHVDQQDESLIKGQISRTQHQERPRSSSPITQLPKLPTTHSSTNSRYSTSQTENRIAKLQTG